MSDNFDDILVKVKKLVNERAALHDNDPSTDKYWDLISSELTKDVDLTLYILNKASKEEFEYYTEVFETISEGLKSEKFVNYLKDAQKRYPDIYLGAEIQHAEKFLGGNG